MILQDNRYSIRIMKKSSLLFSLMAMGLTAVHAASVYTITLTKRADGIHADNGKEQADYARRDVHHIYRDLIATDLFLTPQRAFILPHTCVEERRRGTLEDDRKESSQ